MFKIFTYGTLEIPEVMRAVTGQTFSSCAANARDFARYLIQDRIYPGMIPDKGKTTSGRLYYGVDSKTLHLLDAFEEEVYRRDLITVHTQEGKHYEAFSYIVPQEHRNILSSQPWCRTYFIDHFLPAYLISCQGFFLDMNNPL